LKTNDESIKDINITTTNLDHLGIVAGVFDELGISEVLDEKIPKNRQHKVPHFTIVKAMVLNGLGYTERRLYLLPFVKEMTKKILLLTG
jgi:transposase